MTKTSFINIEQHDWWALAPVVEREIGYTDKALTRKRQDGVLAEGKHWKKAPDGRIVYNILELQRWLASPSVA